MDFLKKHYEKVLLSVVLLGLAVAAALLPMKVSTIRDEISKSIPNPKPKAFSPYDLSTNQMVLDRLRKPPSFTLSGAHNVFNPVRWLKRPDGELLKAQLGKEAGPTALEILKITPLKTVLTYDGTSGVGDALRYRVGMTREADKVPANRPKKTLPLTLGNRSLGVGLKEIKGSKDAPSEVVLEIEGGEQVKISAEKSFSKTMGYMVDLRYAPENNRILKNMRVEQTFSLGGETYNIVAISEGEIVVSAKSSSKRTTVKFNSAP